ncbi:UNVERIFIED_CONTAM: hypothetical protein FKN15_017551 [Acipenser sinensis]
MSEAGPSSRGSVPLGWRNSARKSRAEKPSSLSSSSSKSPSPSPPPKWRKKKSRRSHSAYRGQMDKIWEVVSHQQAILTELLQERSVLPVIADPQAPTPPAPLEAVASGLESDILSLAASEEADDQDIVLPLDDAESDILITQLPLSTELMPLMQQATAELQIPWLETRDKRHSIYDEQPSITPAAPPFYPDFLFELQSTWAHPAMAAVVSNFPPVEAPIAALVQPTNLPFLANDAACPNKMEVILKKAYAANAFNVCLANYNSILIAYQAQFIGSLSENHRPSSPQLDKLISRNLLQLSKLSRQSIGRNMAALLAARRQLWLSQARVLDGDKTALLDTPVTPGHTFGPAVD